MPMCTNTPARKSTFRWSIHREWAFAVTPAEKKKGGREIFFDFISQERKSGQVDS